MSSPAPAPPPHPAAPGDAMVLAHATASVPAARARVAERLGHLPEDVLDDALLVLSELLGNAVRHAPAATGEVEVRWSLPPGAVHLEVVDGGGGGELRAGERDEHATSGRGLAIVEALSQSWGTRLLEGGRRSVWSRITAGP